MGSATRQALAAATADLAEAGVVGVAGATELLGLARAVATIAPLRGALTAPDVPAANKRALLQRAFGGSLIPGALRLATTCASLDWSQPRDLVRGLEMVGIRAMAVASPDIDIDEELFAVERAVNAVPELQLALSSRLGGPEAKVTLVRRLLDGTASEATLAIVAHLAQLLLDGRIGDRLREAARIIAEERGFLVATVVSAVPLTDPQQARLERALTAREGRPVRLDTFVHADVIGGVTIHLGDTVIDGSISGRLHDLRQQLVG